MGYFYAEFFRTRKSGGMKLYGIIPVDSGTACNCSVIGDKDGFHAIGLFHQLHSLFNPREKQVVLSASPSMEMSLMMVT